MYHVFHSVIDFLDRPKGTSNFIIGPRLLFDFEIGYSLLPYRLDNIMYDINFISRGLYERLKIIL